MCINKESSIISFAIGTFFNALCLLVYGKGKHKNLVISICFIWQWVLLMQIFDAIAWKNPECGSHKNRIATKGALISNLTQPLVVFISLLLVTKVNIYFKIIDLTNSGWLCWISSERFYHKVF